MIQAQALQPPNLEATGLTVRRGERLLFEGLGFALPAHAALLLRGPNGAGKTTLLLTLAGILRPEAGDVIYWENGARTPRLDRLHHIGHRPAVKPRLTVAENLRFWKTLNGGAGLVVEAALAQVGLASLENLDAGYLSAGQTRRLALARLLVSRRPLWLLDEPTASLDAEGEALVASLVSAHCTAGGMAVVATHHDLTGLVGTQMQTLTLRSTP